MRIILDAMGGDNAPEAIVAGALLALEQMDLEVILVGREQEILRTLREQGHQTVPEGMRIVDAPDVVPMECDPTYVVKEHKDSSMVVGLTMLRDGEGDAFISAGSTGALISGATLVVKRIRGIRRAALGIEFPTVDPQVTTFLCDAGANAECTPEYLLQFAYMGAFYMQHRHNMGQKARVALLNNGEEETKGTDLQKQTYALLKKADEEGRIRFVGNLEARDMQSGRVDVVVADGFSGNMVLKTAEGVAEFMISAIKDAFMKNPATKVAALLVKSGLKELKKKMDYREIGGTPLLGISKPVLKAHGSSNAKAVCNAIRQACDFAEQHVVDEIEANIEYMKISGVGTKNGD